MAVNYEVRPGETMVISGPANVAVKGGEMPMLVDDAAEFAAAAPTLSALDPDSAESGSGDIVLTVSGDGFAATATIVFGDHDEPTTHNADGTLSTGVKPSLFAPAVVPVAVRNGPARSKPLDFTFTDPGAGTTAKKRKAHVE